MEKLDCHEKAHNELHKVHSSGVWTFATLFRPFYLPIDNRCIIYKIKNHSLALINPSKLIPKLIQQLHTLENQTGCTIRYLISPGDYHHLFIGQYLEHFPSAKAYLFPGHAPSKVKQSFSYELIDIENPLPELQPTLFVQVIHGMKHKNNQKRYEGLFYHAPSRSITCGDFLTYCKEPIGGCWQCLFKISIDKLEFMYNWKACGDPKGILWSLQRVLEYDFDSFISIHGPLGNIQIGRSKEDVQLVREFFMNPPKNFRVTIPFQTEICNEI